MGESVARETSHDPCDSYAVASEPRSTCKASSQKSPEASMRTPCGLPSKSGLKRTETRCQSLPFGQFFGSQRVLAAATISGSVTAQIDAGGVDFQQIRHGERRAVEFHGNARVDMPTGAPPLRQVTWWRSNSTSSSEIFAVERPSALQAQRKAADPHKIFRFLGGLSPLTLR